MRLSLLIQSAGLACILPEGAEREIVSVTADSRTVVPGSLFVCLRGLRADGHNYIGEAVSSGAVAVLTEAGHGVPVSLCGTAVCLTVPDTRRALAFLFNAWYGRPAERMKLIAVTGTNGKTTTATMLKHIFDTALIPAGLIGTVECISRERVIRLRARDETAHMTTPDPEELYHLLSLMAEDGAEVVVMEASSHALALGKLAPLRFAAAVFTNLSPEHLDFHGTMEAYFAAKASLFTAAELAILNKDDPTFARLLALCRRSRTVSGSAGPADYRAEEICLHGIGGITYTLASVRSRIRIFCPQPGHYTLDNSLEAAACALEMGIPPRTVRDALASFSGVPGRLERVRLGVATDYTVFLDYAHTPDALEKLLHSVRDFNGGGRVVLVFGCGGDRDRTKRPAMGRIASRFADMVYITSDNCRGENPDTIIDEILAGIDREKPYRVIPERARAIETAIAEAQAGDLILLAGKGHEKYEIRGGCVRPFDEAEIARDAAKRRADQTDRNKSAEKQRSLTEERQL